MGKLEEKVTKLEEENTKLEGENSKLEGENTKVEGENTKLEEKISKLDGIIAKYSKYRMSTEYEVVKEQLRWQAARKYCTDKGMDLIQFNPKLYTRQGRSELAAKLNLPDGWNFYVGIKPDRSNQGIWRRVADGEAVELEGWNTNYPDYYVGRDFLRWRFYDNDAYTENQNAKNTLWN